ncbi:MAG: DUF4038 domain-containing protein, partial [Verrucomicrobiales bacterium]|nr:DUF4038 domain-containing protein [Verrucomicrobiales bacterium]
ALQEVDPGIALSEEDAITLARHLIARWGAWNVVWLLGGDSRFEEVERWKRIGRAVLDPRDHDDPMKRLATLHPCACKWIAEDFGGESWLDFFGYQSSHGDDEDSLRWHTSGPHTKASSHKPPRPIINLEPNYEAISCSPDMPPRTPQQVRRAAYWSLLISPTAGVSYGHHVIWPWNDQYGDIEGHAFCGKADAWHTGLDAEGAENMKTLRDIFTSGPWADLAPLPELLSHQPGGENLQLFVAAAQTSDHSWSLIYLPEGGEIELNKDHLPPQWQACQLDPITGYRQKLSAKHPSFSLPTHQDYLIEIKAIDQSKRHIPTNWNLLSKIKHLFTSKINIAFG